MILLTPTMIIRYVGQYYIEQEYGIQDHFKRNYTDVFLPLSPIQISHKFLFWLFMLCILFVYQLGWYEISPVYIHIVVLRIETVR